MSVSREEGLFALAMVKPPNENFEGTLDIIKRHSND